MSWGGMKNNPYAGQIKYIPSTNLDNNNNKHQNQASRYANTMMKSQFAMVNGNLNADYDKILKGGCTYLPNFFCKTDDLIIFDNLKKEIDLNGMVNWSKHFKHEDPTFSNQFNEIVERMAKHFNVEVLQTRLNYYKDGTDFKPMHKDRHAYGDGDSKIREDFTMGASFGASRNLDFIHEESNMKFSFPQNNGDVFAFNSDINKKFLHGVPKVFKPIGERFSIIAWGRQKQ
ncbi:2OG-Fe(II) oxygenase superfamily protein [Fadolivirus algeromassiliense]|jgi:hypothetical protein|uniref:2OG-Fe(II) oxygenase superfamily protein n=1 Tax=Fadolivirus FV1/VV64 TaxID=3070911 RepID=A0A7D3QVG6_9VIRU|nr:2OG-Fe(II) oxygenase superfamily protein [Fadolivirus algeromassiliense]QKF93559.1 2OG-Fe(II) oxygenase superfamily protein [Fadolivirus FV1/VV64]